MNHKASEFLILFMQIVNRVFILLKFEIKVNIEFGENRRNFVNFELKTS